MTQHEPSGAQRDAETYLKRPYSRVIVPDDDGTYRAEILEFPGCIATGETEEEAVRSLRDVALSWLESMIIAGRAIPEPAEQNEYSGKLVVRLPKSIHRKAALAAQRDGVSLNSFIVSSVSEQIGMRSAARIAGPSAQVVVHPMMLTVTSQSPASFRHTSDTSQLISVMPSIAGNIERYGS